MFIKAIRQRNSRSNCHLLLASSTVNILNLRWFHFYSSVLGVEGNLPFPIVVIPILILSMLLPLLHNKDSERKPERQSKRRKMDKRLFGYALIWQKTLQICTDTLCQISGGKPLWTRLSYQISNTGFPCQKHFLVCYRFLKGTDSKGFPGIVVLYTFWK